MMQAVIFAVCSLILIAALLWLLLPRAVVEIPAADAEDRELGLYCQPEALWEIISDIEHVGPCRHVNHWQLDDRGPGELSAVAIVKLRQLDAIIKALHKRGYVIMAPCREDIEQAVSLLEGRFIP